MRCPRALLPAVVILFAIPTVSQITGMGGAALGNVKVHVVFENGRPAGLHLQVQLMRGASTIMALNTDSRGEAHFPSVPRGDYHIVVSGDGIQTADSGTIEVDARKATQTQYITVRLVDRADGLMAAGATVSSADLNVPQKARKEFEKASQAMARQDWKAAEQRLVKAISLAPQYVAAYNNLGVVYGRLNDVRHQEDALQKAVNLNDHFAPAFVNLARLQITQRKFADAETKLQTATTLEPTNVESLTLLAYCQLLNQQNAAAIVTAHRADALPNHPAFVHYVAARAQEHLNHLPEAASELSEFLKQEPQGARADHARQELAGIQRAIAHRD